MNDTSNKTLARPFLLIKGIVVGILFATWFLFAQASDSNESLIASVVAALLVTLILFSCNQRKMAAGILLVMISSPLLFVFGCTTL